MDYKENFGGLRIDIQTAGIEMNESLQQRIKNMIVKLKSFLPQANWIDVYLKNSGKKSVYPRKVSVRFGIPGPDLMATDSGYSWKTLLKNVEKKLIRQLNKRKATGLK